MRRLNLVSVGSMAFLLLATAFTAACSSDDTGEGGGGSSPTTSSSSGNGGSSGDGGASGEGGAAATTGTIEVTINYEGAQTGTLYGAVVSDPANPSPEGVQIVPMPTFPAKVTLSDIAPGAWYVVALLDADPADPSMQGPEDRVGNTTEAITVEAGGSYTAEVTIPDTPPGQ